MQSAITNQAHTKDLSTTVDQFNAELPILRQVLLHSR